MDRVPLLKSVSYTFTNPASAHGRYDWRYDEFRLPDEGNLIDEIEWARPPGTGARWLIEADDVVLSAVLRSAPIDSQRTAI